MTTYFSVEELEKAKLTGHASSGLVQRMAEALLTNFDLAKVEGDIKETKSAD